MENFIGQMADFIKGFGKMGNSMVEAYIKDMRMNKKKESGKMEEKLNNLKILETHNKIMVEAIFI